MSRIDATELPDVIVLILCVVIFFVFTMIHGLKLYQDLFTAERKSVSHRNNKPAKDTLYKYRTWLILLNPTAYGVAYVFMAIQKFAAQRHPFMAVSFTNVAFWSMAKTSQYTVFALRLHHTYRHTNYGYPKWILIATVLWGAFGTLCAVITNTLIWVPGSYEINDYVDIYDGKSPGQDVQYNGENLATVPLMLIYVGTEFLIQIVVLVLFLIPLRITIKTLNAMSDEQDDAMRKNSKLAFFGSKVFVLAATAALSTWVAYVIFFLTDNIVVWALDAVLNSVCLMLMSPYYSGPKGDDELLYRTVCKPCIVCCCQVKYSLVYHEEKKMKHLEAMSGTNALSETTETHKTLDTESAAREIAMNQTAALEEIGREKREENALSVEEQQHSALTPPPKNAETTTMDSDATTQVVYDTDVQPVNETEIELEVRNAD